MSRIAASLLILIALGACGRRESLTPAAGQSMPVTPANAAVAPTVDDLLTPSVEARPERSDELLRRSEEREDDRFALPPPG